MRAISRTNKDLKTQKTRCHLIKKREQEAQLTSGLRCVREGSGYNRAGSCYSRAVRVPVVGVNLMRVSNPNLAAARLLRLISVEDKVVCLPHQASPWRAGCASQLIVGNLSFSLSVCSFSLYRSPPLHLVFPPFNNVCSGILQLGNGF